MNKKLIALAAASTLACARPVIGSLRTQPIQPLPGRLRGKLSPAERVIERARKRRQTGGG